MIEDEEECDRSLSFPHGDTKSLAGFDAYEQGITILPPPYRLDYPASGLGTLCGPAQPAINNSRKDIWGGDWLIVGIWLACLRKTRLWPLSDDGITTSGVRNSNSSCILQTSLVLRKGTQ